MIALITPTGGRALQFSLCVKFINRQTYKGNVIWIIIDDCVPQTTDLVIRDDWTVIKIFPSPVWHLGENTQSRNIREGIKYLFSSYSKKDIEGIFIIEDDDYYKSSYLENMVIKLRGFNAAGETDTIYYNVVHRTYFSNQNFKHASLFQTAFTPEAVHILESCYDNRFIDCVFWSLVQNKNLFKDRLSIGIKGLPGRAGIGAGHQRMGNMPEDRNMNYLKSIIGEDANLYKGYYGRGRVQQHPSFNKGRI
jgi:hypothetical protein